MTEIMEDITVLIKDVQLVTKRSLLTMIMQKQSIISLLI